LLLCIIDALSNSADHDRHTLRGIGNIFPGLTEEQIRNLKNWYRNLLAHQAMIMPGMQLSDERTGNPNEFGSNEESTHLQVIPLYEEVKH
jgi:hypothetical protein